MSRTKRLLLLFITVSSTVCVLIVLKKQADNFISPLHKIGREIVLPVKKIKQCIKTKISKRDVSTVLDFGSGTLFWSNWFVTEFNANVYAVDVVYEGGG
jgi:hypothetical protein